MADEKDKIIKDLNNELDALDAKLGNIAGQLLDRMNNKLSDASNRANEFVNAFEKGEDVSKKVITEIQKLAKENNRLSFNRIKLESDLTKAQVLGNFNAEKRVRTALLQNRLTSDQIDETIRLNKQILAAVESEKQITEEKQKQNSVSGVTKKLYDDNFKKTVESFTTLKGIIDLLIKAAVNFNKVSVDVGKSFGYGADQADRLTSSLASAAQNSENVNFTLKNAAEAMNQLNEQTGFVAEYSAKTLETQIMLTKQFGLTAEEASGIYKFSVLTGKSTEQINKSMVGAYVAARNQLGVGIPFRATMAEAAKVSGQLAANLKNNPEFIVKAVAQAKALGVTLEQTKKQGESLLDFESSIEAELRAELLTGQALNLERARAAALMGDQVTVMKELNNQGMTLEKFQNMNVLAQKSFASAIGLSADELANQLKLQKLAVESGKSLVQITEEEALEAQKRQDIQSKFNAAVEKLQDLLGNLVAGPLGTFLDMISSILSHTTALKVVVAGLAGYMVASLIPSFSRLAVIMRYIRMQGIGTAIATAISNPFAAIAGLATAGIVGAYLNSKTADDMVSPGYGKRTILSPEGSIRLNDNDTIIAGTNLGGPNPQPKQDEQNNSIKPDNKENTIKGTNLNRINIQPPPVIDNSALIAAINRQTDIISSKNYTPTLQTVIGGSVVATAATQNSYNLA
jgi:hypothetical protein